MDYEYISILDYKLISWLKDKIKKTHYDFFYVKEKVRTEKEHIYFYENYNFEQRTKIFFKRIGYLYLELGLEYKQDFAYNLITLLIIDKLLLLSDKPYPSLNLIIIYLHIRDNKIEIMRSNKWKTEINFPVYFLVNKLKKINSIIFKMNIDGML